VVRVTVQGMSSSSSVRFAICFPPIHLARNSVIYIGQLESLESVQRQAMGWTAKESGFDSRKG
jgi:hypothetical protein